MKDNQKLLDLIDKAGKGSIEAAEEIAKGYFNGSLGDKNLTKAKNGLLMQQSTGAASVKKSLDRWKKNRLNLWNTSGSNRMTYLKAWDIHCLA